MSNNNNKNATNNVFCERLRYALELTGISPAEFSKRTGIPPSMMSYYLNGKIKPKADRLHIIASTLGVSDAWLMGLNEESFSLDVSKIKNDPAFYEVVTTLARLPDDQYENITALIIALGRK